MQFNNEHVFVQNPYVIVHCDNYTNITFNNSKIIKLIFKWRCKIKFYSRPDYPKTSKRWKLNILGLISKGASNQILCLKKTKCRCLTLLITSLYLFLGNSIAQSSTCTGQAFDGNWFKLIIPEGMIQVFEKSMSIQDFIWMEQTKRDDGALKFFVYAPRHGGTPYSAFVGAKKVDYQVKFQDKNGVRSQFIVHYNDKSTGHFHGNSQLVVGFRILGAPMNQDEFKKFECMQNSIEQYAE